MDWFPFDGFHLMTGPPNKKHIALAMWFLRWPAGYHFMVSTCFASGMFLFAMLVSILWLHFMVPTTF